ncbi:MAG: Dabb family protein [Saprospiraceae bacterium]|nr:Dabb family protein [Saprospiraceae bacterium]
MRLTLTDQAPTAHNTVTSFCYQSHGSDYVYAGGDGGYIDVFLLGKGGQLMPHGRHKLFNEKGPARGLYADQVAGTDFLFVGNKGGNAVEVFRINTEGQLERVFVLHDTDSTYVGVVITLRVIHIGESSYLFVGGLEESPGLSCFRIQPTGELVHVQSMADTDDLHTDGIIGMYAHTIEGNTYLFTGGFQDNGVSSFRVHDDGTFENVNNIADNRTDRFLTGAYPVDGVTLGGNHYVLVGHRHHKYYKRSGFIKQKDFFYHGDGVSVFRVASDGRLVPHHVFIDNEQTKLSGQTRIEVLPMSDQEAIVAVGTRDDKSIQLLKMTEDGKLTALHAYDTGYPIYYGVASQRVEGSLFFIAGSVDFGLKKLYSYEVKTSPERLQHIVGFQFKDEVTPTQIEEAVKVFMAMPDDIPQILSMKGGLNVSKQGFGKGFTHCFNLTFADEQSRDTYIDHPAHLKVVDQIRPLLDDILVFDYWPQ